MRDGADQSAPNDPSTLGTRRIVTLCQRSYPWRILAICKEASTRAEQWPQSRFASSTPCYSSAVSTNYVASVFSLARDCKHVELPWILTKSP